MNLFGGPSTKQRPDSEPRSLGDHGSVFRFLGSQLEGKILRGPMCVSLRDNNNIHATAALLYFGPLHTHNRRREKPTVEEKCHRSYLLFSQVKNNVW